MKSLWILDSIAMLRPLHNFHNFAIMLNVVLLFLEKPLSHLSLLFVMMALPSCLWVAKKEDYKVPNHSTQEWRPDGLRESCQTTFEAVAFKNGLKIKPYTIN